ncbi:hypothetical protein [Curtanaerobium respiraculi]|nr:hypothetical protein [Curtanaerobium respiraculi]
MGTFDSMTDSLRDYGSEIRESLGKIPDSTSGREMVSQMVSCRNLG